MQDFDFAQIYSIF